MYPHDVKPPNWASMDVEDQIEALASSLEQLDFTEYTALLSTLVPPAPKKRDRGLFDHYLHIDPCSRLRV